MMMSTKVHTVKRTWKTVPIHGNAKGGSSEIEIWDGGSILYERWPEEDKCWKVLERTFLDATSFTEILQELPSCAVPTSVMFQDVHPLLLQTKRGFQIPGWTVTTEPIRQRPSDKK